MHDTPSDLLRIFHIANAKITCKAIYTQTCTFTSRGDFKTFGSTIQKSQLFRKRKVGMQTNAQG